MHKDIYAVLSQTRVNIPAATSCIVHLGELGDSMILSETFTYRLARWNELLSDLGYFGDGRQVRGGCLSKRWRQSELETRGSDVHMLCPLIPDSDTCLTIPGGASWQLLSSRFKTMCGWPYCGYESFTEMHKWAVNDQEAQMIDPIER